MTEKEQLEKELLKRKQAYLEIEHRLNRIKNEEFRNNVSEKLKEIARNKEDVVLNIYQDWGDKYIGFGKLSDEENFYFHGVLVEYRENDYENISIDSITNDHFSLKQRNSRFSLANSSDPRVFQITEIVEQIINTINNNKNN